jgi:deoxyribodipyrimidine photolyase-related protein
LYVLRLVLGDQLSRDVAALRGAERGDVVLMAEVAEEAGYVPHHKQKLVLVFSAMRHFAAELRTAGLTVDYVRLDDPANSGSLSGEMARAVARHRPQRVVATAAGEWRVAEMLRSWPALLGIPVDVLEDDRFFASTARFAAWAEGRRGLRMEFFYREMRRESGLLMEHGEPAGARWNFDAENRKPLPRGAKLPARRRFEPDGLTREVMALVEARFPDNFGTLEGFGWAVTRSGALVALDDFITEALPHFGATQDAMRADAPFLHHALLAPYLNLGLLTPREVCDRAEAEYRAQRAGLEAVEGFIRQILGWREYIRGIYWLKMPGYAQSNALAAHRALPSFYWTGETSMNCMAQAIEQTRLHAYSHHIQRLMITGNFALLAGIAPPEVEAWYLAVYADALEWVELPNTHGMALYADGGLVGSKPYAASGAYINRMSNFCADCVHDVKQRSGPGACPFNVLYWAFMIRNETTLSGNPRMAMPYRALAGWDATRRAAVMGEAEAWLVKLG